jgi:hypothetical protein
MKSPIFIVGTQRSGTTLLCKMLTAHPNIFIKNELPEVASIFSAEKPREQIIAEIDAVMQKTYNLELESLLRKTGKKRWGVKDPGLTYCINCLDRHFPDAKIIIIVRDGRAVAHSYLKNRWGVGTNIYYGAKIWKKEVENQLEFARERENNCFIVKYEDLVKNTDCELKRICTFLDESYSERMVNYYSAENFIKKNNLNKNVFNAIDENIAFEWKKRLTPFQINIFETVAGDALQRNQYDLMGKKIRIPAMLKLWFYLHQKVMGEIQLQYRLKSRRLFDKVWAKEVMSPPG